MAKNSSSMWFAVVTLLLAVTPAMSASMVAEQRAAATPLTKVIDLLEGMISKGKAAMKAEQVEYAKFSTWCTETKGSLKHSIKEASGDILQYEASAAKAGSDAETLAQEVGELEAEIASLAAQEKNATGVRTKEHTSFLATQTDFSESIDAIKRAIQVLKAQSADVPQSLLEVSRSRLLPLKAKAALASFLSIQENGMETAPPQANAYEFQSGSVVDLLEKLLHKFQDQLVALQKAELNAKHNYEVLMQQLSDDTASSKASVAAKTQAKGQRLADKAVAVGDKQSTEASKAEDEKDLSETTADCDMNTEEYTKNQQVRADELKALAKAVEILSSETVSGHAEKYLPAALLQRTKRATALAQLRSVAADDSAIRQKVMQLLQTSAQKSGDKYLATLATLAGSDPFAKVKKMIKDLIIKLQEQANSEADHNAYCTSELAKNKMTREDKTAEVEKLSAELDELTATSAQLAKEMAELSDEMKEVNGQRAEATKLRQEEKAQNAVTVADAKESQVAVEKAKQVIAEYYSAAAASFVQTSHKAPYKGMQAEGGNIIDFLEVVLSDFARLEAETSSAEDQAQAEYEKYMAESKQDLAVKDTEMRHKDINKNRADADAQSTKKELDLTQKELSAAIEYYDKLKPECIETGLSYADRKLSREQEIQSLKEALLVLNGEDLP